MKQIITFMLLVMIAGFCVAADQSAQSPVKAVTVSDDDFWKEDWGPDNFPRISDDRINQILLQIRTQNPARADELEKLRKENLDEFRNQLRAEMLNLYRQQPGRGEPPRGPQTGPGGPETQKPEPGHPGPQGPRPEPGSPERFRERWERRHDDFIAWMEKNYPYEANTLKELREKEPDKYMDRVMEKMRTYDPIRDVERKNPKLAQVMKKDLELQIQRDKLLLQIRTANEKDKEKLLADLKNNVSQRFDIIVERKKLQYDELKVKLEELQKEVSKQEKDLEKLKTDKDKLVKEHIDELLKKAEKMDWK